MNLIEYVNGRPTFVKVGYKLDSEHFVYNKTKNKNNRKKKKKQCLSGMLDMVNHNPLYQ